MKPLLASKFVFFLLIGICPSVYAQSFELAQHIEDACQLEDVNGVTVADYDQDGDLDIFVVSIHRYETGDDQTWSRLLRNDGAQGFTDVTTESNLFDVDETLRTGWMGDRMAASWGDYDNDGYPDLFLANNGDDELWHNDGNGQFTKVTEESGVRGCFDCYSSNGLWWDFDLDGDLDLYVSDWLKANRQYRNEGDGTFTDISEISHLNDTSKTWASLPIDVNNDLLPDLYVVNDFGDNILFVNDGNGEFHNATREYGLEDDGDGMGVDVCDYNNDGIFDIYITNIYASHPNPFFISDNHGIYTDQAATLRVEDTGWGWGARFFDADHDLDEDLYVVNGMNLSAGRGDRNIFFENADGQFQDVSNQLGVNNPAQARGLEVFDYDQDGDLDMLVGNREARLSLYKNTLMEKEAADKGWIQIALEGTESNKYGLGAVVEINCQGQRYYRHHTGTNLFGQSLQPLHFGLAHHSVINEIAVTWPTGVIEYYPGVAANQFIKLKEGEGQLVSSFLVTSAPENERYSSLRVFPNPFDDRIIFDFPEKVAGVVEFQLTNALGQVIQSKQYRINNQRSLEVRLSQTVATPGIYFYQISTPVGVNKGKVLKR